jgi:hypothetical protein
MERVMPRGFLGIVVVIVACTPPGPATTPSTGESYATVTTSADPTAVASEPAPPPDPWATATCPGDLSLADGDRDIDGRMPLDTIPTRYAKEHMKVAKAADFVSPDEAIDRVLALEADKPGVVPAGFRAVLAEHGRDPLYMARCELEQDPTTRRAGHDAGLAFLLGATAEEVYPLVSASFYPDGSTSQTCTSKKDCRDGMTCDRVERSCVSKRHKTASFLSKTELAIEDILARAFAGLLTPEMIEDTRYRRGDLLGTWAYGRYTRCSGVLCTFTRYEVRGQTRLVHWDRRYKGESYGGASEDVLTGDAKECFDHTEAADLDQCTYRCGSGAASKEAACITRCQAWCK